MRATRNDRSEARGVRATQAHLVLELERHDALLAPAEATLHQPLIDAVDEGRRRGDPFELASVLDGAQALDQTARGNQLDAFADQLAQARELVHAGRHIIEAHSARWQRASKPLKQFAGDDLLRERWVDLLARLRLVAEVCEEPGAAIRSNHGAAVARGEARQVAEVGGAGDDQRIERRLREHLPHTLQAGGANRCVLNARRAHPSSSLLSRTSASR